MDTLFLFNLEDFYNRTFVICKDERSGGVFQRETVDDTAPDIKKYIALTVSGISTLRAF